MVNDHVLRTHKVCIWTSVTLFFDYSCMNNLLKTDLKEEVPSHVSFQNSKVEPLSTFLLKTFSKLVLTTDNDFFSMARLEVPRPSHFRGPVGVRHIRQSIPEPPIPESSQKHGNSEHADQIKVT